MGANQGNVWSKMTSTVEVIITRRNLTDEEKAELSRSSNRLAYLDSISVEHVSQVSEVKRKNALSERSKLRDRLAIEAKKRWTELA